MHGRLPNATEGAVRARPGAPASAYSYDRSKGADRTFTGVVMCATDRFPS
jgi:hypothetical protein